MKNEIEKVHIGSIAEEMGIEKGDFLISINGKEVKDIIDYRFLTADEYFTVDIEKKSGEVWELEIEKDFDEDLGIEFKNEIKAMHCSNKCMFCFIDQLPKGMRKTLYFKDDDSRLSFLQGNFVTLTNMSDDDIQRIIDYKISPINVSVQTTNPELRVRMLHNKTAGNIIQRIKKLADAGISMNCQIVLCPGVNNGDELVKTVKDLYELYPGVRNVAAVPVGITKYRQNLPNLRTYDKAEASGEIDRIAILQKKYISEIGSPFIRLSDEIYLTAERPIPDSDFYGAFEQLEDGIGMIRYFRDSIDENVKDLKRDIKKSFTIITGAAAYNEMADTAKKIESSNNNVKIDVLKVINHFFGETITVSGLLTAQDIISAAKDVKLNEIVLISSNMLKSDEDILLDDMSLNELEKRLNRKIVVCKFTGEDMIEKINSCI